MANDTADDRLEVLKAGLEHLCQARECVSRSNHDFIVHLIDIAVLEARITLDTVRQDNDP